MFCKPLTNAAQSLWRDTKVGCNHVLRHALNDFGALTDEVLIARFGFFKQHGGEALGHENKGLFGKDTPNALKFLIYAKKGMDIGVRNEQNLRIFKCLKAHQCGLFGEKTLVFAAKTPLEVELPHVFFAFNIVEKPEQAFIDERNMAAGLALTHEKFFFVNVSENEFGAKYFQRFFLNAETPHEVLYGEELCFLWFHGRLWKSFANHYSMSFG